MVTYFVRMSPEVSDIGDMKHIAGEFVELAICHCSWSVGVLERLDFQTFLGIESKVTTKIINMYGIGGVELWKVIPDNL